MVADDIDPPPARAEERVRNIIRGIGSLSAQSALNSLMSLAFLASLLRLLPPVYYGAYASVQIAVGVASQVSSFGLGASVVRHLSLPGEDEASRWGAAKASIILAACFSLVASAAFVPLSPVLSSYFMKSLSWAPLFILGALWQFTNTFSGVVAGVVQGVRKYSLLATILLVSRFVAVSAGIAAIYIYSSVYAAVLSWVVYGVLVIAWVFAATGWRLFFYKARGNYRRVLLYASPLGLAGIVGMVASNADLVVVGGYLDPVSLGVYNAAVTLSSMLSTLLVYPISTAVFPETSVSSESAEEVSRGVNFALRFVILAVLPASLLVASLSTQLILLFSGGGAYLRGTEYLQLITSFYLFVAVQSVMLVVLQGLGRSHTVLLVGLATAVADVLLSLSLVPTFGLLGASMSRVGVALIGAAASIYYVRGHLMHPSHYSYVWKSLVSSLVPSVAVYLLSTYVSSRITTLVPYSLLALVLFVMSLKLLRVLNEDDRRFISHFLPARLQWVVRHI